MKPAEFLERWQQAGAAERANKDSFLAELCDVLGVERPLPKTSDPVLGGAVAGACVRQSSVEPRP